MDTLLISYDAVLLSCCANVNLIGAGRDVNPDLPLVLDLSQGGKYRCDRPAGLHLDHPLASTLP